MELSEAIDLIRLERFKVVQNWADLGCGSGLFSLALANFLPPGSRIFAVDLNKNSFGKITGEQNNVSIEKIVRDFVHDDWPFNNLDGILMCNSLHYVKDKISLLTKAQKYLRQSHSFLVVEYDTERANQWVPYPINFSSLKYLFENAGYSSVRRLNEIPSIYNRSKIYSAFIGK
jgi:ubiquinone/menaquinone biosynthesis C-methylase UbiE